MQTRDGLAGCEAMQARSDYSEYATSGARMNRTTFMLSTLKGILVVLFTGVGMICISAFRNPLGITLGFVALCAAFLMNVVIESRARHANEMDGMAKLWR